LTNTGPDNNFDNGENFTTSLGTGTVPDAGNTLYIFQGFTTVANSSNTLILVEQDGPLNVVLTAPGSETINNLVSSAYFQGENAAGPATLDFTVANSGTLTVVTDVVITGASTTTFNGNAKIFGNLQVGTLTSLVDPAQVTGSGTLLLNNGAVNMDLGAGSQIIVGSGTGGTIVQGVGSTVTTGQFLTIGTNNGTGTYTAGTGSTLNIGSQTAPTAADYFVTLGQSNGASGTLNISSGVTVSAMNPDTSITVGGGGQGTVNQSGTLNLGGNGSSLTIANGMGGSFGTYNLSGALNIGSNNTDAVTFTMGTTLGSTATFNEGAGGALVIGTNSTVVIGEGGNATFSISGGTADFRNGFLLGQTANSTGIIDQSGGTLTAENNITIGGAGIAAYNLSGTGTATFTGVTVSGLGSVTQSGGVFSATMLDLSAVGSSYSLNGGILKLANGALVGTAADGMLNFGGGTLEITSAGAFTDALSGRLTGGVSLIDATSAGVAVTNVMLTGTLTGTGGINFQGTPGVTTFTMTGPNTYTGPTGIISGTLDVTGAGIANSSALNIGNTGTLALDLTGSPGGLAYAGNLGTTGGADPMGQFNVAFAPASTLAILSNSGFTGTITLGSNGTAGNLQVYNGTYGTIQAGAGAAASTVTIGGSTATSPGAPAFPMGITAPTSGVVSITNGLYTGMTTVNSGFTLHVGSLAGGLTSSGGSTLTTFGSTSAPMTANVGSLATTATALNNATIVINTNGLIADKFAATGAADVSNTTFTVAGIGTNTYNIVTGTAVTSTGDSVSAGGALFTSTLNNTGTALQLTTTQFTIGQAVANGSVPALTHNESAVAGSLDPIIGAGSPFPSAFQPILNTLNTFSGAQIPTALEHLTPESLQYARNIAYEGATDLALRMNNVDADLRNGYEGLDTNAVSIVAPGFESGMGRSLQSLLAYNDPGFHSAAPNGVNYYPGEAGHSSPSPSGESSDSSTPAPFDSSSQVISDSPNPYLADVHPGGAQTPVMSEFISGDVILADLNQDQSSSNAPSSKASYTAGDVTAGVSFRITNHFAAGVLFDYNHTDADTDNSGSKTKVDTYAPGIYATYFDHGFYANGLFSFGYNNYDNKRNTGFGTASSSPSGQQYVGNVDFGYDFHPDKQWIAGPTLGLTYTHLDIDSFTESGAPGTDLAVQSQSGDSLRSRLGGHLVYQTNTGDVLLQPNFTAMWQHEFLADSSDITSSFSDFVSNPFTIQTAAPSRDSALIGVGLTATLNNSLALYLNYMADVGASDYFAQTVVGGLKARF
jgi:uncharacterized protein YhjY with autotransporter beta-barrel domain